jgi:hypothetical protein
MKRGSLIDLLVVIIAIFVLAVATFIGYTLLDGIIPGFQEQEGFNATKLTNVQGTYGVVDNMFLFIFIGVVAAVIVSSFVIDTHPIFFVFSIILFAIILLIAMVFKDAFTELSGAPGFAAANTAMSNMSLVWSNIHLILPAMAGLIILALYAKGRKIGGAI